MAGIFPSSEEIEIELDRLRAERAALDAAIAERQLFIELGRRLAGQRRGQGGTPALASAPPAGRPPTDPSGTRPTPGTPPSQAGNEPRAAPGDATRSAAPEAGPRVPARHAPPSANGSILTPRTEARVRGRELVAEAVAILRAEGRPMHAAELVPVLAARGHTLPGHDPVAALNTRLWKRARTGRHVVRHGDAVYAVGGNLTDDQD